MADDIGIQQEMLIEPTHKKLEIIDGHAVKDVEDYQNPEPKSDHLYCEFA